MEDWEDKKLRNVLPSTIRNLIQKQKTRRIYKINTNVDAETLCDDQVRDCMGCTHQNYWSSMRV
jgi:hypothetical protein